MSGKPDRAHAPPAGDGGNGAAGNGTGEGQPPAPEQATQAPAAQGQTGQAAAEEAGPSAAELAAALEAEKARAAEYWDRYLRAAAELDNVRKRAEREMENVRKFALERFATELLAVKDSLELALAAGEENPTAESLIEGTRSTLRQLTAVLERFGVKEVDPEGEPFDPEVHEAMTTQESAHAEPDTVLTVYQKGYTLHGRLLRPARVVVAARPAPESAPPPEGA
jgi:molecular chaperone GrpE